MILLSINNFIFWINSKKSSLKSLPETEAKQLGKRGDHDTE